MLHFNYDTQDQILDRTTFPEVLAIADHLGGFDVNCRNPLLDHISDRVNRITTILNYYVFDEQLKQHYPNLTFKLDKEEFKLFHSLKDYNMHPPLNYKNFICSFNG